ncbi:MAG: hypothetical protein ACR2JJ_05020 [Sphingomicrobium sp.]
MTSTTTFATVGTDISIRWNASLKAYEVTFTGGGCTNDLVVGCPTGRIVPSEPGSSYGQVVAPDGSILASFASVSNQPLTYTSWGSIGGQTIAYGIPTAQGAVPTIGSASYAAEIHGTAKAPGYEYGIYGSALFQFNFGAGTLSGYMDPILNGPMGGPTLPRYTFTQTVYSPGSTTFSGSFDFSGPTSSSFQGQFTGPAAQELMAKFQAPFSNGGGDWGVMHGVMIGKKQ